MKKKLTKDQLNNVLTFLGLKDQIEYLEKELSDRLCSPYTPIEVKAKYDVKKHPDKFIVNVHVTRLMGYFENGIRKSHFYEKKEYSKEFKF